MRKEYLPEIGKISISFCQLGNTMGTTEEYEELTMNLEFQEGEEEGPFYVLSTNGWSIDSIDDLQQLITVARAPLGEMKKQFPEDDDSTSQMEIKNDNESNTNL